MTLNLDRNPLKYGKPSQKPAKYGKLPQKPINIIYLARLLANSHFWAVLLSPTNTVGHQRSKQNTAKLGRDLTYYCKPGQKRGTWVIQGWISGTIQKLY